MDYDPKFLARSREAFLDRDRVTLADLRERIVSDPALSSTRRRDLLSALNRTAQLFGRPLDSIKAHPAAVRTLLGVKSAGELGLSQKTYANLRAAVGYALRLYGPALLQLTRRLPPSPEWQKLLRRVGRNYQRQGLYRLATYCSAMGISPEDVGGETLRGLYEAVEAEEIVKTPKNVIKLTIASWNRCMREIADWPQVRLSTPFALQPWTLPLSAFPDSFQREVKEWAHRMLHPDPLDAESPLRPLRKITVEHRILQFRHFASAVVHRGKLKPPEITSLSILLSPDHFKEGLRFFLDRAGGKATQRIYNLANTLRLIAKHHCRFDAAALQQLETICRRLDPGNRGQMTDKNRERLRQFDDERNVERLMALASKEMTRGAGERNPIRAAKHVERALALGLLTAYGLRSRTLRTLRVSDLILVQGRPSIISIRADETKNGRPLEFEMTDELSHIAQSFLKTYRPRLPGSAGLYLFPGTKGGPRSKNAMYEGILASTRDAGLIMNPHLFRHALGKIVVERNPGAYLAVSQVLGHKTINTTLAHYLGTESKAAGKYLDSILKNKPMERPR